MAEDLRRALERRQLQQERGALRNVTSVAELLGIFDRADVEQLADYQSAHAQQPAALLDNPLSEPFRAKYGRRGDMPSRTHFFTHNQVYYDDAIEEVLARDPVITALRRPDTARGRAPEEVMDAVRARRVAAGFLLELAIDPPAVAATPFAQAQEPIAPPIQTAA